MAKKVLILITKGEIGGAQQSVSYLAQELKKNGLEMTLAYGQGNFLAEKNQNTGINLVNFKHLQRSLNPITNLLLIFEIKKYLEKNKFDILHLNSTNTLFCAIAGKLAKNKPKIIFTFRGLSLLDKNYTTNYFKKHAIIFIYKFLLKFVDTQIFVSQENQTSAQTVGLGKKSLVIYNGLPELFFFNKEESLNFLSKNYQLDLKNKFIIGSIGRLAYQKNYEFLISQMKTVIKINNNIISLIIGSGPEKNKYNNLIKKFNLENNIFILEGIHDAYKIIKAFDIFTLTSRYEGLSITLLEALQSGSSIIVSDVGGNKETLQNSGLLYKLDDENDFINKIKQLILDEKLREDLGNKAKIQFNNFSIKNTANKYLEAYNK